MKKSQQPSGDTFRETRNRTIVLVTAAALIALPAGVIRAFCVGGSCNSAESVAARVPFCSLPAELRGLTGAGYREGRSPNVLAVAGPSGVAAADGLGRVPWPEVDTRAAAVPVVFHGRGVDPAGEIPPGVGLDRIAPTIADVIGLRRAHPEVRSGAPVPGIASGEPPRLVLEVVLKRAGRETVETGWPELEALMETGASTTEGRVPSLPLDPAAANATIGTGGLPRQHGITGTHIRSDSGELVEAWGRGSPPSVIATLPDDLDQRMRGRPRVGLVADAPSDRGLIGGNWYVGNDKDDIVVTKDAVPAARSLLRRHYGRDEVTDFLAVTLAAGSEVRDDDLGVLVRAAEAASDDSLLTVVTATGGSTPTPQMAAGRTISTKLEEELGIDVVEGIAVGGLFIDQGVLARHKITEDEVVRALRTIETIDGRPIIADAFTGIAVSFARYC
jgi:Type I phosphodiesterase / nucleotide pyrophosphatase